MISDILNWTFPNNFTFVGFATDPPMNTEISMLSLPEGIESKSKVSRQAELPSASISFGTLSPQFRPPTNTVERVYTPIVLGQFEMPSNFTSMCPHAELCREVDSSKLSIRTISLASSSVVSPILRVRFASTIAARIFSWLTDASLKSWQGVPSACSKTDFRRAILRLSTTATCLLA